MDENNRELYILGKPIKTQHCEVRFLKYYEYLENMTELNLMSMNVLHFYYRHLEHFKEVIGEDRIKVDEWLEEFKKVTLYSLVMSEEFYINVYYKIFKMVINDNEVIEQIFDDENMFMQYRQLVMDMQLIKESEVNPNPEIQEFIDAKREIDSLDNEKQTVLDIMSSIVVGSGIDYDVIQNWTVVRVLAAYYKLGRFKHSDLTALFSTVSDKVKYETWQKHLDLYHDEKTGMKMSEFNKQYGSLFK